MTVTINDHYGGTQHRYQFRNGYGASLIRHQYSYGGDQGYFELAVLGPDGHIDYTTSITDDVIGWLTGDAAAKVLQRIEQLRLERTQ